MKTQSPRWLRQPSNASSVQQITRNSIVNMNAVSEIRRRSRKGESSVMLLDGRVLPVSRLFASSLRLWISPTGRNHHPAPEESVSPTRPAHSA